MEQENLSSNSSRDTNVLSSPPVLSNLGKARVMGVKTRRPKACSGCSEAHDAGTLRYGGLRPIRQGLFGFGVRRSRDVNRRTPLTVQRGAFVIGVLAHAGSCRFGAVEEFE